MSFEIRGLDRLKQKLGKLPKLYESGIKKGQADVLDKAEGYAVQELQSTIKWSTGELTRSLMTEVKLDSSGQIIGRLYSNDPVAIYREFGTGRNGESSPKTVPNGVTLHYRQTPWFIPADQVDLDLQKIYGMPRIKIKDKYFYRTNGQPARQFMTPAVEKVSKEADEIIKKRVQDEIDRGLS
ncbi:hypothetical protein lacNasYZ03_11700 [Lactobacillus nasalidis]|uniref:HK97 gp10 family phage protein n=1 Tax=Lactobacillus nasalidis TaxID=2797258 RepID=A0ABQ3W615_9LACO|nr:HK97 gp10 family phage protein [Lactobacillus nasalidis]GHV97894.1 hypothetical protein lacNasYZ01_10760 [Lactobacillus nasalidis]GHW00124.1 hypothetical protein lacNasYZ02_15530 [Lactobacillus nasalidis]GHW01483.1 hypothetical protein lacNasYZ03_11700 [Lactobacillus nasalidis]